MSLAWLCTLGNLSCGLGAVALLWLGPPNGEAWFGWLVLLGAVLDGLDGPIARWGGGQSHWGGRLDTLADAVSFGLAPAAWLAQHPPIWAMLGPICSEPSGRVVAWLVGGAYLGAVVWRLERFERRRSSDPLVKPAVSVFVLSEAHSLPHGHGSSPAGQKHRRLELSRPTSARRRFVGLPAPAAACLLALLSIVGAGPSWLLAAGLTGSGLMVARLSYPKRPYSGRWPGRLVEGGVTLIGALLGLTVGGVECAMIGAAIGGLLGYALRPILAEVCLRIAEWQRWRRCLPSAP
jgi:phosphatidylserine synthase